MPCVVSVNALGISSRECSCSCSRKCTCREVEVATAQEYRRALGISSTAAGASWRYGRLLVNCVAYNEISCRYKLRAAVAPSRSSGQQCTDCYDNLLDNPNTVCNLVLLHQQSHQHTISRDIPYLPTRSFAHVTQRPALSRQMIGIAAAPQHRYAPHRCCRPRGHG